MLSKYLIDKYRSLLRQRYLNDIGRFTAPCAFIGAGNHSIANLYPCIRHLNIPIRYICTQHKKNAVKMAASFPGCTGTGSVQDILDDPSVKGVFICTKPRLQHALAKKLLQAGKHVFIEKPPAYSLSELDELALLQGAQILMVGLQRRFSTMNKWLQKLKKGADSYHYRYLTGPYPEGDPVYELFIHPIDNIIQLFGKASISKMEKTGSGHTVLIMLTHGNGVRGTIELSTDYPWSMASEYLEINTVKEILQCHYPYQLTGITKTSSLLGLPMDKVLGQPARHTVYLGNNGFIPTVDNNSLVMQGFYGEIREFASLVEKSRVPAPATNARTTSPTRTATRAIMLHASAANLVDTYRILDQLKELR